MNVSRSKSLCCVALLGVACSGNDNSARTTHRVENTGTAGSNGTGGRESGGGGTGSPAGVKAEAGVTGAKLKWQVIWPSQADGSPGVEGVKVCVDAHPAIACVMTDAGGNFTLPGLPGDTELVLLFEKDGYLPVLKPIETSNIDMEGRGSIAMLKVMDSPRSMFQFQTDPGFDIDTKSKGSISFFVVGPEADSAIGVGPLLGGRAALSPAAGDGPIYRRADGALDLGLEATDQNGGNFFFNVPPGDYEVRFTAPPGFDCASISFPFAGWGYPIAGEPAVHVPVRQGHITGDIGVLCTPGVDAGSTPTQD
jgi:hypothetical protein